MPRTRQTRKTEVSVSVNGPKREIRKRKAKEGPKYEVPSDEDSSDNTASEVADVPVDNPSTENKPSSRDLFKNHQDLKTELNLSSSESECDEETPSCKKSIISSSKTSKRLQADLDKAKNQQNHCVTSMHLKEEAAEVLSNEGLKDFKTELLDGTSIFDSPVKDNSALPEGSKELPSICKRQLDLNEVQEDPEQEKLVKKQRKTVLRVKKLKEVADVTEKLDKSENSKVNELSAGDEGRPEIRSLRKRKQVRPKECTDNAEIEQKDAPQLVRKPEKNNAKRSRKKEVFKETKSTKSSLPKQVNGESLVVSETKMSALTVDNDDDDFEIKDVLPQPASRKLKKTVKILSSDEEEEEPPIKKKAKTRTKPKKKTKLSTGSKQDSDSSDSNWEEVEDLDLPEAPASGSPKKKADAASKGLEIDIELPDKKKKKGYDWAAYFQRLFNRKCKEIQLDMHKAHLVCYMAHGFFCNSLCNNKIIQSTALSLIPPSLLKQRPKRMDFTFLTKLISWFRDSFPKNPDRSFDSSYHGVYRLLQCVEQKIVHSYQDMALVFVVLMRALGEDARLVISFQPVTMKSTKLTKKTTGNSSTPKETQKSSASVKEKSSTKTPKRSTTSSKQSKKARSEPPKLQIRTSEGFATPKTSKITSNSKNHEKKGKTKGPKSATKNERLRRRSKVNYREEQNSDNDDELNDSDYQADEDVELKKGRLKASKKGQGKAKRKSHPPSESSTTMSSDSDFDFEIVNPTVNVKPLKKNMKILSSDSEENARMVNGTTESKAIKTDVKEDGNYWCEVYLASLSRWISVDCIHGQIDKPQKCEALATQPLTYVVAFDNANSAKDVTQKFASKWLSHTHKLRIETEDEDWWQQTLLPYKTKNKKRDKQEDAQIQAKHEDQPLPTSLVEYKNHPLYALKRHLLKFEAIYPESAAVLGYCKGEAVYSRDCVHILKSRHTWIKEARVVKQEEQPYKMVKKLVNPFKPKPTDDPEPMLDVYGFWQTEKYIPPPCKNGKVPRNEYGNVELFQPCMLPKGGVHLQIQGLHKTAARLNIDAAPVIIGWDYHCRHAVPIMDGYVVCKENAEVLVAAWEEEQEEIARKKKQKKEQRALKHWKLLTKSLLIRERLKKQYQLEEPQQPKPEGKGKKAAEKGTKKQSKVFWPENKMTSFQGCSSNLLPFEKGKHAKAAKL